MDSGGRHQLERRAYGPDSSPAEIEALRARVYLHRPNVIMYREAPVQSAFQLELFEKRLSELVADVGDDFVLLIDLTDAGPPSAETRAALKSMFAKHCRGKVAAAFTGKNFLLNVAAKFVLGSILGAGDLKSYSVHKTLEEAERAIDAGK